MHRLGSTENKPPRPTFGVVTSARCLRHRRSAPATAAGVRGTALGKPQAVPSSASGPKLSCPSAEETACPHPIPSGRRDGLHTTRVGCHGLDRSTCRPRARGKGEGVTSRPAGPEHAEAKGSGGELGRHAPC